MLTLEKYNGTASRHTCPACGGKRKFTRYVDESTGRYLSDNVGRCDRESSCGYHLKPGEYYSNNPGLHGWTQRQKTGIGWQGRTRENGSQAIYSKRIETRKPDFIDSRHLIESIGSYDQNAFVQFLIELFRFDTEAVNEAIGEYRIGTGRNGETIFWQIDQSQRIRTGKLIAYEPATGKRRKDRSPDWIHAALKRSGDLPESFELRQCLFGEHLLSKYPGRVIAIVEAEKTAVIASICKAVFPDLVWLATGGLSNLKAASIARVAKGRKVFLFPDANAFDKWQRIASEASRLGVAVKVSDLLEQQATDEQKAAGLDLADYLIEEQRKRNDPANREAFRELIEERLAIMTIDGGLTEEEAEAEIIESGYYAQALRTVLDAAIPEDAQVAH